MPSITLHEGDAFQILDTIADKSVQAVIIDPPYNIDKADWDTIENYVEWLVSIIEKAQKKLKDNGSFFMFHNDMEQIAEIMIRIKSCTHLVFRQMIVWNKRFDGSPKKGFLDGYVVKNEAHNWNKMAEYILFYTFDNTYKLKKRREELGISQMRIGCEIPSKTGGMTGWYSNLETGKNMPTLETIAPITKHLGISFDEIVPKFRNQKTHHSVWNYDIAKRSEVHITPKPIDLLINILNHVTDEGDTVLDCFAGSGTLGHACKKINRNCILIEKDPIYCEHVKSTLSL